MLVLIYTNFYQLPKAVLSFLLIGHTRCHTINKDNEFFSAMQFTLCNFILLSQDQNTMEAQHNKITRPQELHLNIPCLGNTNILFVQVNPLKAFYELKSCAFAYYHLWPVWLYHLFSHYLTNSMIFRGWGRWG